MAATILQAESASTKIPDDLIDAFGSGQLSRAEFVDRLLEWKTAGAKASEQDRDACNRGAKYAVLGRLLKWHEGYDGTHPFFGVGDVDESQRWASQASSVAEVVRYSIASDAGIPKDDVCSALQAIVTLNELVALSVEIRGRA